MTMDPDIRVVSFPNLDAAGLLPLAEALLDCMKRPADAAGNDAPGGPPDPILAVARLDRASVLLGRYQRAASALRLDAVETDRCPIFRRAGGGRAILAPPGTVAFLLALPFPGSLLPRAIPADRVLNRYVRGVMAALRRLGAAGGAFYTGRDFILADHAQIGVISQQSALVGPTLFEAVLAMDEPLELPGRYRGYPEHSDLRAAGPAWTAVGRIRGRTSSMEEIVEAISEGYEEAFGCRAAPAPELEETLRAAEEQRRGPHRPDDRDAAASRSAPENTTEQASTSGLQSMVRPPTQGTAASARSWPSVLEEEQGWNASGVAEIPIGFLEALIRIERGSADRRTDPAEPPGDGLAGRGFDLPAVPPMSPAVEVRFRGDFILPEWILRGMEDSLRGCPLEYREIGKRIDSAYRRSGAFAHGLPSLRILAEAVLAAVA